MVNHCLKKKIVTRSRCYRLKQHTIITLNPSSTGMKKVYFPSALNILLLSVCFTR